MVIVGSFILLRSLLLVGFYNKSKLSLTSTKVASTLGLLAASIVRFSANGYRKEPLWFSDWKINTPRTQARCLLVY